MPEILLTLVIFHFDISGIDCNEEQPENILEIFLTFIVFHSDLFIIGLNNK